MVKQTETPRILVTAPAEVVEEIDKLVEASPFKTSRSAVALAAIEAGLPHVKKQLQGKR